MEHCQFGVYIHVPFCVSKCGYCDFCRVTDLGKIPAYISSLENEILFSEVCMKSPSTIYVGGGTPSCLRLSDFIRLLDIINSRFDVSNVLEFTVECNPDDVTPEFVKTLVDGNVNRVSLGCQSLDDRMLRFMGRRHDSDQVRSAIRMLRSAGISNISVDLIFGLPEVEGYSFSDDIARFVDLDVPHLSAYALSYEEGSRFSKMLSEGKLTPASDDVVADQYEILISALRAADYNHYEISNYARAGFEAIHNSSYWDRIPYWGFGPAASSFYGNRRWTNTYSVDEYVGNKGVEVFNEEVLSDDDIYNEVVMLRLRTSRGFSMSEIPVERRAYLEKVMSEEIKNGNLVCQKDGMIRIPERKWFVADAIIERLFA